MSDHEQPQDPGATTMGHPKGLWVLFITEMWERFSYYGMRALLVFFLVASTSELVGDAANSNPGFGWTDADAYTLYGVYTFMVYLTSIFGGFVADRMLGTHRSMLIGGWIIAAGHITLAMTALFSYEQGLAVSLSNGPGALTTFLAGLSLIIIGTGFFKPCVSVMVGQLYGEGDPRRDSGFTIFYMGINLGAFLSPLIAGTLGEKVGWHWGFGSAAVGMIAGLFFYQRFRPKYLLGIGDGPDDGMAKKDGLKVVLAVAGLLAIPLLPLGIFLMGGLDSMMEAWGWVASKLGWQGIAIALTTVLVGSIGFFLSLQPKGERSPLAVIFVLAILGNLGFWTAFEQAGSSMSVFALESTDRTLFGMLKGDGFPATWYQSVNALTILICAPIFSWLWIWLARRRKNPSTPMKFAIGLWLLGLAFLAMVAGAWEARNGGLAAPHWLLITYVTYTWGELCLSPVGLSMVTKLAPLRLQSLMMGLWFFSLGLANLCAGLVARFSTTFVVQEGATEAQRTFIIDGQPGFYLMLVVFPIGTGVVIWMLSPMLKKMMQGKG